MSAIPVPKLWTPSRRIVRPRRWDWLKLPVFNMGRLFSSSGWNFASSGGDFGSANKPCCLYQARYCSDGTLAGIYVRKSAFAFPGTFYFSYSGTCYSVSDADVAACSNTPITPGTTYSSCSACTGGSCPDCSTTSATYALGGLDGVISNTFGVLCGIGDCSYSGLSPWPAYSATISRQDQVAGVMYNATSPADCAADNTDTYGGAGGSTGYVWVYIGSPITGTRACQFSDGNYCLFAPTLACGASGGGPNDGVWRLGIQLDVYDYTGLTGCGPPCGVCTNTCPQAKAVYERASITGTYSLSSWNACGYANPFPSTCTIS